MKYSLIILGLAAITWFSMESFTKQSIASNIEKLAPAGGIKFDHSTLAKAKTEAQNSKKLIFIDVYTTWCGPCKEMAKTTFTDEEVGELFNKKFVNLKIDAENDSDGAYIASNFKVNAYPTLLFLDENGKLLKKLVGKQSKEKLMSIAESL